VGLAKARLRPCIYIYLICGQRLGLKAIADEPRNSPAGATKAKFENVFPYVTKAECAKTSLGQIFCAEYFFI
jgi:hypothetical protein